MERFDPSLLKPPDGSETKMRRAGLLGGGGLLDQQRSSSFQEAPRIQTRNGVEGPRDQAQCATFL